MSEKGSNQPQGMGLEKKQRTKQTPPRKQTQTPDQGPELKYTRDKTKAPNKNSRSGQAASGTKDVAQGAERASRGATKAAGGAARISAGDWSGVKDVASGTVDTVKGAKQMGDGVKDLKESTKKKEPAEPAKAPNANDPSLRYGNNPMDRRDPYNPENYESLFKDKDEKKKEKEEKQEKKDKKKKKKESDKDDKKSKGKGMKDLMSDEDDDDNGDDQSDADSMVDDKEMEMPDLKGMKRKAEVATVAGTGAAGAAALKAFMMFLQWLKGLASQAMAAVSSLWASIVSFAQSAVAFVASITGFSAVSSAIVTGVTGVMVGATVIGGASSMITTSNIQRDDPLACLPSTTSVSDDVMDWASSGEVSLMQQETIKKAWSVFSELGINQEVAAGVLGNFTAESSLDPTAVETIYDEPFAMGPKKQAAMSAGFKASVVAPDYYARFNGAVNLLGVGIAQWSNGRNTTLMNYANDRGLDWFEIGTQLAFMFDGDNPSDVDTLWDIANQDGITVSEAASRFVHEWERPNADALNMSGRQSSAANVYLQIETMEVDTDYAQSIISQMNVQVAEGNHNQSAFMQDDGCGEPVSSHYKSVADGTGVFPTSVTGTMWAPDNLPEEVKAFAHNPTDAGMAYAGSTGWIVNNYPGQCVAFADSYMENLYGVSRPGGVNGGGVARAWYNKYKDELGGTISRVPSAGAVFSYMNPGVYGHTGVVQHVFANGDILVAEQNINGISGDNNGTPYTWGWRYIPVERYAEDNDSMWDWEFYKPAKEPQWVK